MLCADWATRFFFYPSKEHVGSPAEAGLVYDLVTIPAEDGAPLEAWYFPARAVEGGTSQALVVHAHGNGGNLSNHWPVAVGLTQRGFDVLTFDYRGYGRSPGRVTRSRAAADVRSVLDHASARARREGIPLVLLGQSMGAALALEVAPERSDLAAVVADSPFSSWSRIAWHHYGRGRWYSPVVKLALGTLFLPRKDPVEHATRLSAPLLVISGTSDKTCPTEMSEEIARRVPGARLYCLPGADHVGQRTAAEGTCVFDEIAAFVREATGRTAATHAPARP